jgi:hypothetical protein
MPPPCIQVAYLDNFLMPSKAVLTAFLCVHAYTWIGEKLNLENTMMELICIVVLIVFFGLSLGMIRLLELL